jgi:hypothetical protein
MKLRDVIAILLGTKKPVLIPIPKNNNQLKR